jgi:hypothetical protein
MRRCTMLLGAVGVAGLTMLCPRPLQSATNPAFTITVDKTMWSQWGFQYPVTYIFRVSGISPTWEVKRRDSAAESWKTVPQKTPGEFFNGIECARLDKAGGEICVSVGFHGSNTIELELRGFDSASLASVAKFYDNRKAAFTLSNDNWGCNPWGHPGAPWRGTTDDASDNYQASLHVCRSFALPVSMAVNSRMAGREAMWRTMQQELDRRDCSWEPAVHGWTHPRNPAEYAIHGYKQEILGCRGDILSHLRNIPYGQHVYEHILTYGHADEGILDTEASQFLFVRGFNWLDNPTSTDFAPWNPKHGFYGVGGLNTVGYDRILERREPKGRFDSSDVAELNAAFDKVYEKGGLHYALWHPDRFRNSVLYDPSPGVDGHRGSTLVQHLAHVARRKDVWYVANGWLYSYRYVAQNARVAPH